LNARAHSLFRDFKEGPALRIRLVESLFARCPTFVAGRAVTAALRLGGVKIGRSTVFWGMPTLTGQGDVGSRLTIGSYCGFNARAYFELDAPISIGNHVAVGQDALFLTRTYDTSDLRQRAGKPSSAPVEIGDGAWLGARCTIMPGVKIGAGSVVGASVVVSSDVPPNILVMGKRRISIANWR